MSAAHLRRLAWPLAAAFASLVITVQPFRDSDVWWHLAVGRYILAHGIPSAEPFSFLHAANPWVGQQWLFEVGLARIVGVGGAGLASVVMGCVGSLAMLVAVLSLPPDRRPTGPWLAAGLLASAVVSAQVLGVRGQVMSLLFTAVVINVLARWRAGSVRPLLVLPPLFALWANIHAGFVVGLAIGVLVLVATRGAGSRHRGKLAVALAAAVLATLVNPAGSGLWSYVAATFTNPTLTGVVTEWQSPDFHDIWLRLFELEAIVLVVAWVLSPRRDLLDMLLGCAAFAASLEAQRNVSLFALVAAPQVAAYGSAAYRAHRPRVTWSLPVGHWRRPPRWFGAAVAAVVVAGAAVAVAPGVSAEAAARYEATHEPEAAASYVASHLVGRRLYSIDTWGGYLAGRFPVGRVVFVYDETEVFGDPVLQEYLDIHDLRPDWADVVARTGIAAAVLPERAQEVSALITLGWTVDCTDAASGSLVMSANPGATTVGTPVAAAAGIPAAPACA